MSEDRARELPPLGYSLRERKVAIALCWCLIIIDSCILALALFYSLWYATNLSKTNIVTIVSSLVGIISLVQFFWRFYVLIRKDDWRRPLGANRWSLDFFQWTYIILLIVVILELTLATVPQSPVIGLLSMPLATIVFVAFGAELMMTLAYFRGLRAPIRISSLPRGAPCRPGLYTIVEDVIAVDGNGGTKFRNAWNKRYEASPPFRAMLARLSLFWSIPALLVASGTTACVWTTSDPVAFGIGWSIPFVWACVWALVTVTWVRKMLKQEQKVWDLATRLTLS